MTVTIGSRIVCLEIGGVFREARERICHNVSCVFFSFSSWVSLVAIAIACSHVASHVDSVRASRAVVLASSAAAAAAFVLLR